jgi:hypothetical protein
LVNRGHLRFRAQHMPEALADYEAALAVNPSSPDALYARGVVRSLTGNPKDGAADMLAAVNMDQSVDARLAALRVTTLPATTP